MSTPYIKPSHLYVLIDILWAFISWQRRPRILDNPAGLAAVRKEEICVLKRCGEALRSSNEENVRQWRKMPSMTKPGNFRLLTAESQVRL